eukprot:NODE_3292_length_916_cov_56.707224_g3271_i0.p1 GENE.NODE_3292_length_916_cov_56.707224_g3271_i0~~NODE_3292_length_916_cov_56.707224_g3271_i0.p1  ORF type:complete len:280 (-),score=79.99 NODE_3292_length_916_cov_56.707224_g3271_i0:60-899(-)
MGGDVRKLAKKCAKAVISEGAVNKSGLVRLRTDKLEQEDARVTLKQLNALHTTCTAALPEPDTLMRWVFVAYQRFSGGLNTSVASAPAVDEVLAQLAPVLANRQVENAVSELMGGGVGGVDLVSDYEAHFRCTHRRIVPLSCKALRELCAAKGIAVEKLQCHSSTYMLKNACLSPECPHFLRPMFNFSQHMNVWGVKLPPAFHKTVRAHMDEAPAQIVQRFLRGEEVTGYCTGLMLHQYDATEAEAIEYAKVLVEAYKRIDVEDKAELGLDKPQPTMIG